MNNNSDNSWTAWNGEGSVLRNKLSLDNQDHHSHTLEKIPIPWSVHLPCLPSADVNLVNIISYGVFPAYVGHEMVLTGVCGIAHGALKLPLPRQVGHHVTPKCVVVAEGLATEAASLAPTSELSWWPWGGVLIFSLLQLLRKKKFDMRVPVTISCKSKEKKLIDIW